MQTALCLIDPLITFVLNAPSLSGSNLAETEVETKAQHFYGYFSLLGLTIPLGFYQKNVQLCIVG